MKELIIFGRSPFINRLDFDNLDYDRFDICCINSKIPQLKRVDYIISADEWCKPDIPDGCEWISVNTGWELIKVHNNDIIQQPQRLSWKHYSSDLAVNFAILRGYKKIYLAGIDMVEDGKPLNHYDGILNTETTTPSGCLDEKVLIKYFASRFDVKIYQLNPESNWLKFKDIGILPNGKKLGKNG